MRKHTTANLNSSNGYEYNNVKQTNTNPTKSNRSVTFLAWKQLCLIDHISRAWRSNGNIAAPAVLHSLLYWNNIICRSLRSNGATPLILHQSPRCQQRRHSSMQTHPQAVLHSLHLHPHMRGVSTSAMSIRCWMKGSSTHDSAGTKDC